MLFVGEVVIFLCLGVCVIINLGFVWGKDFEIGFDRFRLWLEEMLCLENDVLLKIVVGEFFVIYIGFEMFFLIFLFVLLSVFEWMFLFLSRVWFECVDLFFDLFFIVFFIFVWWKVSNEFDEFESGFLCVWVVW